jgi:hypothetical protein
MRCRARVGREIGRGWSGMDRTRDWVMGLDEYLFKSTIPVVGVDAVPIRASTPPSVVGSTTADPIGK